ncbi:homoserine kinase [Buchnera aphidicola (Ceratoglyphina bambusae)]|uniref:homoserine kinase n=1 Tax=Buchnera aphidicola TaxID=9 RepID=UPI0031B839BA
MITVYSPATIGNISVGFDTLGLAISPIDNSYFGDIVIIKKCKTFKLKNIGKFSKKLPKILEKNVVWKCWKYFCKKINKKVPMSIILKKNMPIGSGLGSSACSISASLFAMNEFCKNPLSKNELLILMGKLEGKISGNIHFDNVAPCFLGGLQIILQKNNIISQSIPFFQNWIWVIAWPGTKISTLQSRKILPKKYNKQTCIDHSRNLAGFIHASYSMQENLAIKFLKDKIAEPYRIKIIPKFLKTKKIIKKIGAIGFGISGSGPTIFSICNSIKIAKNVSIWLSKNYLKNKKGFVKICKVNNTGTIKIR